MRFLACALMLAACAARGQDKSDWERANEERLRQSREFVVPPPSLERAALVELRLHVSAERGFRHYVDPGSVSVEPDDIVRYVLVTRSASGAESVTFEGLRCPREYRVYAVGKLDGSWGGRASDWRPVPRDPNAAQSALARDYFCIGRGRVASAEEARRALRAGGQPVTDFRP